MVERRMPVSDIRKRTRTLMKWGLVFSACLLAGSVPRAYAALESIAQRWAAQTGSADSDFGRNVAVDLAGNVYVVGYTSGSVSGSNSGGTDVVFAQYSSTGALRWIRQTGTPQDDFGYAIAVDTAGKVYIAGSTFGSLNGAANPGGADAFVLVYSTSGLPQGTTMQVGTEGNDEAFAVAVSSGNIYIAGYTNGPLNRGASFGGADIFVDRFNMSGATTAVTQLGTASDDVARAVVVDASGNVAIAGSTSGGLGGRTPRGGRDAFITLLTPSLASAGGSWPQLLGSANDDDGLALATDGEGFFLAGTARGAFSGTATTSIGGSDAFLAKYLFSGDLSWAQIFGTEQEDNASGVAVNSRSGSVFVSGTTLGSLGATVNAGSSDIFLVQFDPSTGSRLASRQKGTPVLDVAGGSAADPAGNILVTGQTWGDLGGNARGKEDIFLLSFSTATLPYLRWTFESGYTSGGLRPMDSTGTAVFTYRVDYVSLDNRAPAAGYPKVHVRRNGAEVTGSPFSMNTVTPGATTYASGVFFTRSVELAYGDYTYFFEALDTAGNFAVGIPTAEQEGPFARKPEAINVKMIHGVFKPGEGEHCTLSFTFERAGNVGITVYDSLGSQVRELFRGTIPEGPATFDWDGRDADGSPVASGVYVFRIDPGGGKLKKAVVIR